MANPSNLCHSSRGTTSSNCGSCATGGKSVEKKGIMAYIVGRLGNVGEGRDRHLDGWIHCWKKSFWMSGREEKGVAVYVMIQTAVVEGVEAEMPFDGVGKMFWGAARNWLNDKGPQLPTEYVAVHPFHSVHSALTELPHPGSSGHSSLNPSGNLLKSGPLRPPSPCRTCNLASWSRSDPA